MRVLQRGEVLWIAGRGGYHQRHRRGHGGDPGRRDVHPVSRQVPGSGDKGRAYKGIRRLVDVRVLCKRFGPASVCGERRGDAVLDWGAVSVCLNYIWFVSLISKVLQESII